jgi:hypothetical protein
MNSGRLRLSTSVPTSTRSAISSIYLTTPPNFSHVCLEFQMHASRILFLIMAQTDRVAAVTVPSFLRGLTARSINEIIFVILNKFKAIWFLYGGGIRQSYHETHETVALVELFRPKLHNEVCDFQRSVAH